MEHKLCPGLIGEATNIVEDTNTALHMGSGDLSVYATPAMAALMEAAALRAVAPALAEGMTTVGTQLAIRHIAATPIGLTIRARAELTAIDGKKLTYNVQAFDEKEKIGEGVHERCIVQKGRFLSKTAAKQ